MSDEADDLPEVCVVYIVRTISDGPREVLLGRKKSGLGLGRIVAPGGKLEPGETPRAAAVREVEEEVGLQLDPIRLKLVGELTYKFPHRAEWSQKSWVFTADDPGGDAREANELSPHWTPVAQLPLGQMWADAQYWLEASLGGEFTRATFEFAADGKTVAHSTHQGFAPS